MKKRLWMVMGAALAIMAVGVGTSFALFTSQSPAQDNEFTTGEVCIEVNRNAGENVPGPMFYITPEQGQDPAGNDGWFPTGLWVPGDAHTRSMTVEQCPNGLAAILTSVQASLDVPGGEAMAERLYVKVTTPDAGGTQRVVAEGYLDEFLAGPVDMLFPVGSLVPASGDRRVHLAASGNRHLYFDVEFDLDADDSYENTDLVVTFTINAVQAKNNPWVEP